MPDLELETSLAADGCRCIAGVDEAGRGPLAGPVVAAAVILDPRSISGTMDRLDDSKKLDAPTRAELEPAIKAVSIWAVAEASVPEIDSLNILQASMLAMKRAVEALSTAPDAILIDGNRVPEGLPAQAWAIVRGDARSMSIAAASVLAKQERDRIMTGLAGECPGYGWEGNMGYPTKSHREALLRLGVTEHHRTTFGPVRNAIGAHPVTARS